MQSSMIGKIEKAKLYAREPGRVTFQEFSVQFRGNNDSHTTGFKDGKWVCTCDFFQGWGICAHTMALEKMIEPMLPAGARTNFEVATRT
jgi:hypothetical protein